MLHRFAAVFFDICNSFFSSNQVLKWYRMSSRNACTREYLFQNIFHIQTLLHLNRFQQLDEHLRRTIKAFIFMYVGHLTQHFSGIDQNQLRHILCLTAQMSLAFDVSSLFLKKDDGHRNEELTGTIISDQILRLRKLLQNAPLPTCVILLHTHQHHNPRFPLLHLVRALFSQKPQSIENQTLPPLMRLILPYKGVIVDI